MVDVWQEVISTQEGSQEMTKEKKKKEKPVAMSLSEFRQSGSAEGIQCVPKSENSHSVKGLDDFLEWPDDSTIAVTQNHMRSNLQGQITTSYNSVLTAQSSLINLCLFAPYSFMLKKLQRKFRRLRNAVIGNTSHRKFSAVSYYLSTICFCLTRDNF